MGNQEIMLIDVSGVSLYQFHNCPDSCTSYILVYMSTKLITWAFDIQASCYSHLGFGNLEKMCEMILSGMHLDKSEN